MGKIGALILSLYLPWATLQAAEPEQSIRITIGEWPPFMGQSLPSYGPVSQIISEVFALSDTSVNYGFYPWKRSMLLAQQGRWAATAVWGYTAERSEGFLYSEPLFSDELLLVSTARAPIIINDFPKDANKLCGKRVGLALGSEMLSELQELEEQGCFSLLSVNSEEQAIQLLLKGRVDAVYVNRRIANEALQKMLTAEQQQLVAGPVLGYWHYHVLFSRNDPLAKQWQTRFNQGLAQLQKRGRVDELLAPLHLPTAPLATP